jgi:hypothetical protein
MTDKKNISSNGENQITLEISVSTNKVVDNKQLLVNEITEKFNEKVYWDEPTDKLLILARTYCFWLFHENYPEYKLIKSRIKFNKNAVKTIIDRKSEKDRKIIDEHIELYQWKEDNYGSVEDN